MTLICGNGESLSKCANGILVSIKQDTIPRFGALQWISSGADKSTSHIRGQSWHQSEQTNLRLSAIEAHQHGHQKRLADKGKPALVHHRAQLPLWLLKQSAKFDMTQEDYKQLCGDNVHTSSI